MKKYFQNKTKQNKLLNILKGMQLIPIEWINYRHI